MESDITPYCPSLDESIVPLNYVATYIIEIDKETKEEKDRLDHLDHKGKLRRVWDILNEEEDLKDVFDVEKLWKKPSLRKSWADAERLRKIGNSKYAKGMLTEALNLYNEALCFLPPKIKNSEVDIYPLIIANRSMVLYEMGSYKLSLKDIKLAQESSYPQHLLYKLKVRQGACFWGLSQKKLAMKCFEQAEQLVEKVVTSEEQEKAMKYIKGKKSEVMSCKSEMVEEDQVGTSRYQVPDPHQQYPAFSSKVDIRETPAQGRHVVARESIKPGDVIAVDSAILGELVPSKYSTNCLHCLASVVRIFPCSTCSKIRFCSVQCQREAEESYHGFECKLGLADLYAKVRLSFLSMLMRKEIV